MRHGIRLDVGNREKHRLVVIRLFAGSVGGHSRTRVRTAERLGSRGPRIRPRRGKMAGGGPAILSQTHPEHDRGLPAR